MKNLLLTFLIICFISLCNFSNAENGITYNDNLTTRTDLNWNPFAYWSITVEFSWNSITIMDRNLWATTNDINSPDSYWYYYQWWNNYWFNGTEPKSTNRINNTTSPYYSSTFITIDNFRDNSFNNNLWWGGKDEKNIPRSLESTLKNTPDISVRQWPCPEWWHVPSIWEWTSIVEYIALNNNLESIYWGDSHENYNSNPDYFPYGLLTMNSLKLPLAGMLTQKRGEKRIQWEHWTYRTSSAWSSSKNTFSPIIELINWVHFTLWAETGRSSGFPVRCFKNNTDNQSSYIKNVDKTDSSAVNDIISVDTQTTVNEWNENTEKPEDNKEDVKEEIDKKSDKDNSRYQEWNQSEILSNWYSREFNNAYKFANLNWVTTMNNINQADMNWWLTRIAMAKMLSQYAINILWKTPDTSKTPNFSDVNMQLDASYNNWVTLAYQLWIMWMWLDKFRPHDTVTRAEFGTALSRMLFGLSDWSDYYYSTHLAKLKSEWIINNDNPNLKEQRWYVMLMLMRSAK